MKTIFILTKRAIGLDKRIQNQCEEEKARPSTCHRMDMTTSDQLARHPVRSIDLTLHLVYTSDYVPFN
jgi:hypothetical protein